ncbi:hypothetical protein E2C01_098274 [Portunus trituberculatus]|uniref:Uncharacterized protein n=1 Tax=Portunus trituberculatus TaxID=210409 RepID=A0A5B7KBQ1_PORTR|nr:hypothetical protein [Portunus trituberculatus]
MVKTRTFSNLSKQNLYLRSDSGKTTRPEQTRLRHSVTRHGNPHRAIVARRQCEYSTTLALVNLFV